MSIKNAVLVHPIGESKLQRGEDARLVASGVRGGPANAQTWQWRKAIEIVYPTGSPDVIPRAQPALVWNGSIGASTVPYFDLSGGNRFKTFTIQGSGIEFIAHEKDIPGIAASNDIYPLIYHHPNGWRLVDPAIVSVLTTGIAILYQIQQKNYLGYPYPDFYGLYDPANAYLPNIETFERDITRQSGSDSGNRFSFNRIAARNGKLLGVAHDASAWYLDHPAVSPGVPVAVPSTDVAGIQAGDISLTLRSLAFAQAYSGNLAFNDNTHATVYQYLFPTYDLATSVFNGVGSTQPIVVVKPDGSTFTVPGPGCAIPSFAGIYTVYAHPSGVLDLVAGTDGVAIWTVTVSGSASDPYLPGDCENERAGGLPPYQLGKYTWETNDLTRADPQLVAATDTVLTDNGGGTTVSSNGRYVVPVNPADDPEGLGGFFGGRMFIKTDDLTYTTGYDATHPLCCLVMNLDILGTGGDGKPNRNYEVVQEFLLPFTVNDFGIAVASGDDSGMAVRFQVISGPVVKIEPIIADVGHVTRFLGVGASPSEWWALVEATHETESPGVASTIDNGGLTLDRPPDGYPTVSGTRITTGALSSGSDFNTVQTHYDANGVFDGILFTEVIQVYVPGFLYTVPANTLVALPQAAGTYTVYMHLDGTMDHTIGADGTAVCDITVVDRASATFVNNGSLIKYALGTASSPSSPQTLPTPSTFPCGNGGSPDTTESGLYVTTSWAVGSDPNHIQTIYGVAQVGMKTSDLSIANLATAANSLCYMQLEIDITGSQIGGVTSFVRTFKLTVGETTLATVTLNDGVERPAAHPADYTFNIHLLQAVGPLVTINWHFSNAPSVDPVPTRRAVFAYKSTITSPVNATDWTLANTVVADHAISGSEIAVYGICGNGGLIYKLTSGNWHYWSEPTGDVLIGTILDGDGMQNGDVSGVICTWNHVVDTTGAADLPDPSFDSFPWLAVDDGAGGIWVLMQGITTMDLWQRNGLVGTAYSIQSGNLFPLVEQPLGMWRDTTTMTILTVDTSSGHTTLRAYTVDLTVFVPPFTPGGPASWTGSRCDSALSPTCLTDFDVQFTSVLVGTSVELHAMTNRNIGSTPWFMLFVDDLGVIVASFSSGSNFFHLVSKSTAQTRQYHAVLSTHSASITGGGPVSDPLTVAWVDPTPNPAVTALAPVAPIPTPHPQSLGFYDILAAKF